MRHRKPQDPPPATDKRDRTESPAGVAAVRDPSAAQLVCELPCGRDAGGIARRQVARELQQQLNGEEHEVVALLVSELINNAVLHGGAAANDKVTLRISVAPERVRVEVSDAGVGFRRLDPQQPCPDGTGGYGLVLVDMLASRWDVDTTAGACVWFELDRRSERTAR